MKLQNVLRGSAMTAVLLVATLASADKAKPGTKGTATSYEADKTKVIHVEQCDEKDGEIDYVPCVRAMREATITKLCKRGPGTYKWYFQVGDEKSMLNQSTSCSSK